MKAMDSPLVTPHSTSSAPSPVQRSLTTMTKSKLKILQTSREAYRVLGQTL
uniref:Uncharacterized protein n=1 Tax=Anguilla anguilla TaxID=7936 RepID=A0A0E9WMD3_ANGAN